VSNNCYLRDPLAHPHRATMPDYGDLTDLQLTIMSVLWSARDATIGTIHERLGERGTNPVARKTIAMLLSRLEQRGLVSHRMEGRESLYRARVAKKSVLRSRMASLLGAVFVGQPRLAGANALDPADVRAGDVDKLVAMLRQLERDVQKDG
jgi:predicted transcriptional regulator